MDRRPHSMASSLQSPRTLSKASPAAEPWNTDEDSGFYFFELAGEVRNQLYLMLVSDKFRYISKRERKRNPCRSPIPEDESFFEMTVNHGPIAKLLTISKDFRREYMHIVLQHAQLEATLDVFDPSEWAVTDPIEQIWEIPRSFISKIQRVQILLMPDVNYKDHSCCLFEDPSDCQDEVDWLVWQLPSFKHIYLELRISVESIMELQWQSMPSKPNKFWNLKIKAKRALQYSGPQAFVVSPLCTISELPPPLSHLYHTSDEKITFRALPTSETDPARSWHGLDLEFLCLGDGTRA